MSAHRPRSVRLASYTAEYGYLYVVNAYAFRLDLMRECAGGAVFNETRNKSWVVSDTAANRDTVRRLMADHNAKQNAAPTPAPSIPPTPAYIAPDPVYAQQPKQQTTQEPSPMTSTASPIASNDQAGQIAQLAQMLATVLATANKASPIDADQVNALIDAKVAHLASPPPTQVTIIRQDRPDVTLTGLHHHMLPQLIRVVSTGLNVWISGPTGGGKTHAIEQVAEALGLPFYLQGSMGMAHELIGFRDAAGNYADTPFVAAYRNGGVICLDEVDRGSNEAVLSLNAALANGVMSTPAGEMLRRHKDFRCIATANTWGGGGTTDYVGAARLDAAFLQRFGAKLHWTYDTVLERALASNNAWVDRVQRARTTAANKGLKVIISPRASYDGAVLIAAGFSPDEAAGMTYLSGVSDDHRRQLGE